MARKQPRPSKVVRIQLTEEQRARIRKETGKEANAVEFDVEELEERVAPRAYFELF